MTLLRSGRSGALSLLLLGVLSLGGGRLTAQNSPDVPDRDLSPYQRALFDYKSGNYDSARTAIDAAETAKPGDPATEILKARILTELLDFDEAAGVLKDLEGKPGLTTEQVHSRMLALGDLALRRHSFPYAMKIYESLLAQRPGDADLLLKAIYARIGSGDLTMAEKYASSLKPFDRTSDPLDPKHPGNPAYYFAKAALSQATGKGEDADTDLQTAQTIYGIILYDRYLKTYLEVFAPVPKSPGASTNAVPTGLKP